jgi:DNA-binding NarL/FixJ family response regulator
MRVHDLKSRVRVAVADDQPISRQGLICLLDAQPDFEVVGEMGSIEETIEVCGRLRPDVLLLDVRVSGGDGPPAVTQVLAAAPRTRILAIAESGEDSRLVIDALRLVVAKGAEGAIRRNAQPADLYSAIRALASGATWHQPSASTGSVRRAPDPSAPGDARALSEREAQVARMVANGRSNKEIATSLQISDRTVKKHVSHILRKLDLQSRLQLGVFIALHPHLLTLRGPGRR